MKKIGLLLCFIFFIGTAFAQDAQSYFDKGSEYANAEKYSLAISYFEKANELAGGNNSVCQHNIGLCYDREFKYTQAVYWYRKAAEQGFARAQANLGNCYWLGYGVKGDEVQAVSWWRKAAEQGDAYAQYRLGECYAEGKGLTKNLAQAAYWYRKAAEQGYGSAQGWLSMCYYYGTGVAEDVEQAKYWGQKAIANENTSPMVRKMVQTMLQ